MNYSQYDPGRRHVVNHLTWPLNYLTDLGQFKFRNYSARLWESSNLYRPARDSVHSAIRII